MGIGGMRGSWGGGVDAGKGKEEAEGKEAKGRDEKRAGVCNLNFVKAYISLS